MAFDTALSGLNAAAGELSVIGNNIANSSTNGFKQSRAIFADVFAVSGGGLQIGSGVRLADVQQEFTQGNISFTNNALDLAINGSGFFTLSDNGNAVYSRSGAFNANSDGVVVNTFGQRLQVFQADSAGNITGATGDLTIDTSNIAPQATTTVDLGINVDAQADIPLAPVATTTITPIATNPALPLTLDPAGSPYTVAVDELWNNLGQDLVADLGQTVDLSYVYDGTGNDWHVELQVAGSTVGSSASFDAATSPSSTSITWDPGVGDPIDVSIDLSTVTVGNTNVVASADGSTGQVQGQFDPDNANSFNNATSVTTYDSLGGSHLATYYFVKSPEDNVWEVYTYVDGVNQGAGTGRGDVNGEGTSYRLTYSDVGELQTIDGNATPPTTLTIPSFSPSVAGTASQPQQMTLTLDFGSTTQYGAPFAVNAITQDGYTTGQLSTIDIDSEGVVFARYSNGQARALGQVVLTNFANPNGLRSMGDNGWAETSDSGVPLTGLPGSGNLGLLQSGALEESNVDITEQLVSMITAQRNFQANAQVIQTEDTITQTVINIR